MDIARYSIDKPVNIWLMVGILLLGGILAMSKIGVRNIDSYNERLLKARQKGEVITRNIQVGFDTETGQPVFNV